MRVSTSWRLPGSVELFDAVLHIDRVHEGLHQPERLRGRFPVSGIGQHAIRVAKFDTTVKG